jgi:hypothetical protein
MSRLVRRKALAAGLLLAAGLSAPARAQIMPHPDLAQLPDGRALVASTSAEVIPPPPPPECSCGDRRGMQRWWWHRTRCKRHLQDHFLGYLEEFNEWPLGASLYAHGRTQVGNGEVAQMIFYQYDFQADTGVLNDRGRDKLARIAAVLPISFAPVLIERTSANPALAEMRRQSILAELCRQPFPVPPERVVVAAPIAQGLRGEESNVTYSNQLNHLRSFGQAGGIGGSASGLDGSGLSGSAVFGGR